MGYLTILKIYSVPSVGTSLGEASLANHKSHFPTGTKTKRRMPRSKCSIRIVGNKNSRDDR